MRILRRSHTPIWPSTHESTETFRGRITPGQANVKADDVSLLSTRAKIE
jgi:hypothetical protein